MHSSKFEDQIRIAMRNIYVKPLKLKSHIFLVVYVEMKERERKEK